MNIRASASTDSQVVATARAGDSFAVSQSRRGDSWCWLQIGEVWIARTSRVTSTESSTTSRSQSRRVQQPAQQQTQQGVQQQTEINNCCFVDRQCDTEDEWTSGYWAFQNNQCEAPAGSQTQSQTRGTVSEEANNCCFIGWHCDTDEEWRSGYWAFQHDQCDAPQQWQEVQWPQLQHQQRQQQQRSQNAMYPVSRTYDPYTGTTVFTYAGGEQIIVRKPTREELCNAGLADFCDDE